MHLVGFFSLFIHSRCCLAQKFIINIWLLHLVSFLSLHTFSMFSNWHSYSRNFCLVSLHSNFISHSIWLINVFYLQKFVVDSVFVSKSVALEFVERIPATHVIGNMIPEEKQTNKTAVLRSRQNFIDEGIKSPST